MTEGCLYYRVKLIFVTADTGSGESIRTAQGCALGRRIGLLCSILRGDSAITGPWSSP